MKVEIFSKADCPFCVDALKLAARSRMQITEIKLNRDMNREEMIKKVQSRSGVEFKTFPQIFLDGEYIGGFEDFNKKIKK
jgi:glutaredoxin